MKPCLADNFMNSALMSQYIEFVADRLALQLGSIRYSILQIRLISWRDYVEEKQLFRKCWRYALANKEKGDDVFDLDGAF